MQWFIKLFQSIEREAESIPINRKGKSPNHHRQNSGNNSVTSFLEDSIGYLGDKACASLKTRVTKQQVIGSMI